MVHLGRYASKPALPLLSWKLFAQVFGYVTTFVDTEVSPPELSLRMALPYSTSMLRQHSKPMQENLPEILSVPYKYHSEKPRV